MENNEAIIIDLVNRLTLDRKEIVCYPNETFLALKRKLGVEINVDTRRIQFYDERLSLLNNNDVVHDLRSIIYDENSIINKQITPVILEIRNNHFELPKWIQINSNDTIGHLKNEISKYGINGLQTFVFNQDGVMLEGDDKTIESLNLVNGSKIKIWRGPNLLVTMKFYINFNNVGNIPEELLLKFSMTDPIKDVKKRISESISPGSALNLALITDSSYWQNDKRLIDYPIKQEGTEVFVIDLQRNPGITFGEQIKNGKYAKIFDATDSYLNRIRVNRYKLDKEIVNKRKVLKYAIISHTLLNRINNHKFVELYTMYADVKYFYIATEYIEQGSLKTIYSNKSFSNREVIRYSIQICQALDFMHSNKFMHRNLNCSSVLVDNEDNIKLTNFHLSKYLFNATMDQLLEGIPGSRIETSKCWLAPEVLRNDPYGLKSDIWSLAVTVLEMFTHDRPYPEMNVLRATHRIVYENAIHYNRNLIPGYFHDFLDRCLRVPHWERPSAKQCIQLLEAFPKVDN